MSFSFSPLFSCMLCMQNPSPPPPSPPFWCFMFKREHLQCGPSFQTIFPFLMTMTKHNLTNLLCISIDWFLYDKKFYWNYILEKPFYFVNAPDYCFKFSLSRIACVNSSVKELSPQYEGPLTHIFHALSLCSFIIYRKKEIGFVANFLSKYFFWPKVIPNHMSS